MKSMIFFILLFWIIFSLPPSAHGQSESNANLFLDAQEFITSAEAQKRWGTEEFSVQKFKNGSQQQRAAMASSLTRNKDLLGKTASEVRNLLGSFSGHFWSERVPTYLIEEGWKTGADTWQIVFLLNDTEKVAEIRIHKNCCSKK